MNSPLLKMRFPVRGRGTRGLSRRWVLCLAAALAWVLLLPGCAPSEEPDEIATPAAVNPFLNQLEEEPVVLPERFALPYEPDHSLDPIACPDGMQQVIGSLLYEGLFRLNQNLEPVPCLCDSYGYDAASRTWTIVLRQGVTFSDGSPLTAREVKTSLDRAKASQRYGSRLRNVSTVTAAGDTLFVALFSSSSGFPALLDVPICKESGDVPLGTGPYCFVREDGGAWLVAREDWWQGGGQPVDRIFLEESQDAMLYRFTSGDVHLIVSNLISSAPASITGDIRYRDTPTTRLHFLSCNTSRPPLQNAAVRRALNLGIPRKSLVSSLLSGHAIPAQFPVSPVSPLYPKALEQTYSAAALPAALAEIDWQPERPLVLLVNGENSFKVSVAQAVAAEFTKAGADTEVRVLPWEEYQEAVSQGDWDLCYGEAALSADWNLSPLLGASGSLNLGNWMDWRGTQLMSAFQSAEDRPAAMYALCEYLRENVPLIPLCFGNTTVLTQAEVVENLNSTAAEPFYNLKECVIHLRED